MHSSLACWLTFAMRRSHWESCVCCRNYFQSRLSATACWRGCVECVCVRWNVFGGLFVLTQSLTHSDVRCWAARRAACTAIQIFSSRLFVLFCLNKVSFVEWPWVQLPTCWDTACMKLAIFTSRTLEQYQTIAKHMKTNI